MINFNRKRKLERSRERDYVSVKFIATGSPAKQWRSWDPRNIRGTDAFIKQRLRQLKNRQKILQPLGFVPEYSPVCQCPIRYLCWGHRVQITVIRQRPKNIQETDPFIMQRLWQLRNRQMILQPLGFAFEYLPVHQLLGADNYNQTTA